MIKTLRLVWDVLAIGMLSELCTILWSYLAWEACDSDCWIRSLAGYFFVPWLAPLIGVHGEGFDDALAYEVMIHFFVVFSVICALIRGFRSKRRKAEILNVVPADSDI